MKNYLITTFGTCALTSASYALLPSLQGGIMLGGGYLDNPGKAFGFGQFRGAFYEDDAFAHTVFLEVLGHTDDAVLEYAGRGGSIFLEDGEISFVNVTLNYELEAKLGGPISFFIGAGAGVEFVSLDDSFDYSIDTDSNYVAQAFGGFRANFQSGFIAQIGARYLMRDDFALLGDQFVTEDSWAYEASFGLRF